MASRRRSTVVRLTARSRAARRWLITPAEIWGGEFAPSLAESLEACPAWPAELAALAACAIYTSADTLNQDPAF